MSNEINRTLVAEGMKGRQKERCVNVVVGRAGGEAEDLLGKGTVSK